jgi:hypothetical protein
MAQRDERGMTTVRAPRILTRAPQLDSAIRSMGPLHGRPNWWMHLMVCVWLIFAALLFVIEPLIIRRTVDKRATAASQATLTRMLWMHRVMLALSLLAIFAAIGGSHGLF